jgi:hypothetical protein
VSRVLVVASDLMARERIRSAADRLGMEISFARPGDHGDVAGFDVVVLDLDEIGAAGAEAMATGDARILGYYSHVDVGLGQAAEKAGITAVRRGRFWSDLDTHLAG